ncbi:hypothetical protein COLO4_08118 [Corchorus olitorius]|uniref:Uncharacterized protein n=1 Tax=Corchorus olitorius TaxID=93759 RepID=A0A1R3KH81_9ROSI|nr:hypothetical protein COLO4_08118 [Corchorus olitorius]
MKKDESTGDGTKQSRLRRRTQSLRHTSVGDVVNLRLPFETDNEGGGGSRHCRSETGEGRVVTGCWDFRTSSSK